MPAPLPLSESMNREELVQALAEAILQVLEKLDLPRREEPPDLMTVAQAAKRFNLPLDFLRRKDWPFRVKLVPRGSRVSASRLQAFLDEEFAKKSKPPEDVPTPHSNAAGTEPGEMPKWLFRSPPPERRQS